MMVEVLIPLLLLAALSLLARITLGSWLAPGAFFPLFWTCLIGFSLAVPAYPIWEGALWWILATIFLFYLGNLMGGGVWIVRGRSQSVLSQRRITFPKLRGVVVACCVLAVLYIVLRDFVAPITQDQPGGADPPPLFQLLLSALYAAPLFGGMLFASDSTKRGRQLAALSVAPAFIYSLTHMGRSPMLAGIFFWLAGYWSVRILLRRGVVPLITPTIILAVPLLVLILTILGILARAARQVAELPLGERLVFYGKIPREADWSKLWYGFRSSLFAHPYAFSYYLRNALDNPPALHYGAKMFRGPLDLLGLQVRTPFESFEVDPGVLSNVYTLFMPPIEDFGLEGSFIAFWVCGFIAGWAYRRVAQGCALPIPILTMFYPHVMVIGGYFFAYNSMILSHLAVWAYLVYFSRDIHNQIRAADGFLFNHGDTESTEK